MELLRGERDARSRSDFERCCQMNIRDAQDLDTRLKKLNQARPNCQYYAITLTADDDLKVVFAVQTMWVGWADNETRHELRRARSVYGNFVGIWERVGQPYSIIHTVDELTLFLLGGGNALVEKDLAQRVFARLLEPSPSVPDGLSGFKDRRMFDESAFRRAPTPKVRMQILKRDDRRCKICGRRPDDNSDLELHVHHIRPWAKGGVTDLSNLITLCHTCHNGLTPHFDYSLFDYLQDAKGGIEAKTMEFFKGVANYRKVGFFGNLGETNAQPSGRGKSRKKARQQHP
jgi:hypothetical protein